MTRRVYQALADVPETTRRLLEFVAVDGLAHRHGADGRPARSSARRPPSSPRSAPAFARRAHAELARIGGRTPTPTTLTATEHRVARLVAQGRTNRAIADALFISPKTVEANLAGVYRAGHLQPRQTRGGHGAVPPAE
ncbi:helix-turn-helix transcriptional regulator [Micromonospora sp. NBC_00389]|uniref:helix-turn-helix transcriptional regulator n=1 Tax=Micromonospora sp. NBC_00389 TaxID=2903586 RepID=UPI002E1C04E3